MKYFLWSQRIHRGIGAVLLASLILAGCSSAAPGGEAPQAPATSQPASAPRTAVALTAIPATATQLPATKPAATAIQTAPPPPAPTQPPPAATTAAPVVVVSATSQPVVLQPTPACTAGMAVTPAQTEGPYYKINPPQRVSLLSSVFSGTKLTLTGYVLTQACKPVAGARVDFWQADDAGAYDNGGYNFRGYQTTDAAGRYTLQTVVPGLYPGRTRHIHVKVQAPNQPELTTQLYFPDEPSNTRDSIFSPQLLLNIQKAKDGELATFNFILPIK